MFTPETDSDLIRFIRKPYKLTVIPPNHLTPAAANWSLVIEVGPPMVEGRLGEDGSAGDRTSRQSPGLQDFTSFQHQVPMLRRMVVLQDHEAGHITAVL